jgi:hypothetical protein
MLAHEIDILWPPTATSIWRSRLPLFFNTGSPDWILWFKKIKITIENFKRTTLPSFLPTPWARRPTPISLSRTNPQDGVERRQGWWRGGAGVLQACAAARTWDSASYGLRTRTWLLSALTPHRGHPRESGGMLHPSPTDAVAPGPRIDKQSHEHGLLHRRSAWALALRPSPPAH